MKRLLCWFGFHSPLPGVTRARSLYWCCARCGQFVPGDALAKERKR